MEQMDQDENDCIIMESYINREKLRCPEMFQIDFVSIQLFIIISCLQTTDEVSPHLKTITDVICLFF